MWRNNLIMDTRRKTFKISMVLLILVVTSCAGLTRSEQAATRTWLLHPGGQGASAAASAPVTGISITVTAIPGLDNDRILTLSGEGELNHISGARWADNVPELVTSLVARTLQQTAYFDVDSSRSDSAPKDCGLQLLIQEFYVIIGSAGHTSAVRLAMTGTYRCRTGKYQAINLNASIPVQDPRMGDVVAAFQHGMDDMLAQLLDILKSAQQ